MSSVIRKSHKEVTTCDLQEEGGKAHNILTRGLYTDPPGREVDGEGRSIFRDLERPC